MHRRQKRRKLGRRRDLRTAGLVSRLHFASRYIIFYFVPCVIINIWRMRTSARGPVSSREICILAGGRIANPTSPLCMRRYEFVIGGKFGNGGFRAIKADLLCCCGFEFDTREECVRCWKRGRFWFCVWKIVCIVNIVGEICLILWRVWFCGSWNNVDFF